MSISIECLCIDRARFYKCSRGGCIKVCAACTCACDCVNTVLCMLLNTRTRKSSSSFSRAAFVRACCEVRSVFTFRAYARRRSRNCFAGGQRFMCTQIFRQHCYARACVWIGLVLYAHFVSVYVYVRLLGVCNDDDDSTTPSRARACALFSMLPLLLPA